MNILMWRTNNKAIRYCDYPEELLDHFAYALQNCVQMFRNTSAKYDGTEQRWGQGDSNIRTLLETTFKSWNCFHEFKLDENKPSFVWTSTFNHKGWRGRICGKQVRGSSSVLSVCRRGTCGKRVLWSTTHYCAISDQSWEILGMHFDLRKYLSYEEPLRQTVYDGRIFGLNWKRVQEGARDVSDMPRGRPQFCVETAAIQYYSVLKHFKIKIKWYYIMFYNIKF
jgi:hypothetical protein